MKHLAIWWIVFKAPSINASKCTHKQQVRSFAAPFYIYFADKLLKIGRWRICGRKLARELLIAQRQSMLKDFGIFQV